MAFVYPPLPQGDSLRLLVLDPGDFWDELSGSMTAVTFSSRPRYFALSYTWEDPNDHQARLPAEVKLRNDNPRKGNSKKGNLWEGNSSPTAIVSRSEETTLCIHNNAGRLPVSHNLALALRHLRSPTHPLTIWADAVCINQADVPERNSQVALMFFIYKRAVSVVVWLGVPKIGSDKTPVKQAARTMANRWRTGKPVAMAAALAERKPRLELAYTPAFANEELKHNAYWTRLWIVQEVCLAQRVVFAYGDRLWNAEQVRKAAGLPDASPAMKTLLDMRQKRYTDAAELGNLIQRFGQQQCSDIRDRIYGLLGLSHSGKIPVDYDATPLDIWLSVVSSIISRDVLEYKNWSMLSTGRNLVWLSSVVQHALDGQVAQTLRSRPLPQRRRRQIHQFEGFTSTIIAIGPSYDQYIASAAVCNDWAKTLAKNYSGRDLEHMREIEDKYCEKMIGFESADLERISQAEPLKVTAMLQRFTNYSYESIKGHLMDRPRNKALHRPKTRPAPVRFLGTNCCTGLVPAGTRVGDCIIGFDSCLTAIAMRGPKIWEAGPRFLPGAGDSSDSEDDVYMNWDEHMEQVYMQRNKNTQKVQDYRVPEEFMDPMEYIGRVDLASLPRHTLDPYDDVATVYADWVAVQKIAADVDVLPFSSGATRR